MKSQIQKLRAKDETKNKNIKKKQKRQTNTTNSELVCNREETEVSIHRSGGLG